MQLGLPEEKLSLAHAMEHQNPGKLMNIYRIPCVYSVFVWDFKTPGCPEEIPIFASQLKINGWHFSLKSAALEKEKYLSGGWSQG